MVLVSLAVSPALLSALGRRNRIETVQVTGLVRLVGNNPFPELVISGTDREWYVEKDEEHKLIDLQHRTVTVEGVETVRMMRFANGLPAGERYSLENIKVIAVD